MSLAGVVPHRPQYEIGWIRELPGITNFGFLGTVNTIVRIVTIPLFDARIAYSVYQPAG